MTQALRTSFLGDKIVRAVRSPAMARRYVGLIARYLYLRVVIQSYTVRHGELAALRRARAQDETGIAQQPNPLVTVTIATYNRGQLLDERALRSVLAQSYQNFEVIVVGDGCTDDTGLRIARLNDPRIRFFNLPERSTYPENHVFRWMVAGSPPLNRALAEARGTWIAHLDDDEIFLPDHLAVLIEHAYKSNAEFVYSQARREVSAGEWFDLGMFPPFAPFWVQHHIPHSAILFRNYLSLFRFEINAWKVYLPVDFHLWLRMSVAGVRMGFLEQVTTLAPLRPETTHNSYLAEDRV